MFQTMKKNKYYLVVVLILASSLYIGCGEDEIEKKTINIDIEKLTLWGGQDTIVRIVDASPLYKLSAYSKNKK